MSFEIENKLNIWKDKYPCAWYQIGKKIKHFFRKIKWAAQRSVRGYCDRDLWSLDYTIGNFIASSVNELANITHGYPYGLTEEKWDAILRGIAMKFYLAVNEDDEELWENPFDDKINHRKFPQDWNDEERDTWEKWLKVEEYNAKERDRFLYDGLRDLREWFRSLWD